MKLKRLFAAVLVLVVSLAACASDEKYEEQLAEKNSGIEALKAGDTDTALSHFDTALMLSGTKISAQTIDISYYKACALVAMGDINGAIGVYDALIDYDEKDYNAYFLRGSLYLKNQDTESCFSDYKKAAELAGADYELYQRIYYNLTGNGQPEKGIEFLNMALAIEGQNAVNYYERGRIYYIMQQYDVAESALKNAIEKGYSSAWIDLARVYIKKGELDEAQNALSKFTDQGDNTGASYNAIGLMYMEQGAYDLALAAFQQGLLIDDASSHQSLLKNEISALEFTGDFVTARIEAASYVEQYPDDPSVARELVFLSTR